MLDWLEVLTRLGGAAVLGGAIGLNRHAHHKPTGVRTLSLVAAGAAGLVLATLHEDGSLHVDAVSRVIQGIMTGLGFIGAGVIMRGPSAERAHGLTTAACVWVTASLGALCGIGAWKVIVPLAAIVALILLLGGPLERRLGTHAMDDRKESG